LRERKDAARHLIHDRPMGIDELGGDKPEMVNTDEMVSALLTRHPRAARVLLNHGMHCVGCAIARFETLAEACAIYGIPVERLLRDLEAATTSERNGNT
jgi:hybrid cluster-associated redox disulfide protein